MFAACIDGNSDSYGVHGQTERRRQRATRSFANGGGKNCRKVRAQKKTKERGRVAKRAEEQISETKGKEEKMREKREISRTKRRNGRKADGWSEDEKEENEEGVEERHEERRHEAPPFSAGQVHAAILAMPGRRMFSPIS